MRFKISDQKAREKIIRRGMWNIVGVPMVVTKWTPRVEEEKQEEDSIPMWINISKVPLHMYSWEGLSLIASPVGVPVKLHPETLACTNFEIAKVFVNADVSKPLPKEMIFSKDGRDFTVVFEYPYLPTRCKICHKWGHGEKVCTLRKKGNEVPTSEEIASKAGEGEKIDKVMLNEDEDVEVEPEGATIKNKGREGASKQMEEAKDSNVENWLQVSLGKVGRSPPRNDVEIQISASKYSFLSINEEEEGEIMGEAQDTEGVDVKEHVENQ